MPVFELEAGGKTYEIEAPSQEAALAVIQTQPRTDAVGATARGVINGVPIIGPALLEGTLRASALASSLIDGKDYGAALKQARGYSTAAEQEHPKTTIGSELAGGVAGTLPAMAAAPAAFGISKAPMLARSAMSALTGGAIGGADAAARSGGDLEKVKTGAAVGGMFGAAAPALGQLAGKTVGGIVERFKPTPRPTVQELKDASNAAYTAAENAGARYSASSTNTMINDVFDTLRKAGIDRDLHPKAVAAARRLGDAPAEPTIRELDTLRQIARDAAGSIDAGERRIGSKIIGGIDDFVAKAGPSDVVGGDPKVTSTAITEARSLWNAKSKAETIQKVIDRAERQASSSNSGGNYDNSIRQGFKSLRNNDKLMRGFSADERAAIDQIITGSKGQNAARATGKLLGGGGGLGAAMTAGVGGQVAGPLALAPLVGFGFKRASDAATAANVAKLQTVVANRGVMPRNMTREYFERIANSGSVGILNQRDVQDGVTNQARRASNLLLGR